MIVVVLLGMNKVADAHKGRVDSFVNIKFKQLQYSPL